MIKKNILLGALALAATVTAVSADKLTVMYTGYPIYSEDLSNVKEISYAESSKPGTFNQMRIDRLDGTAATLEIFEDDEIIYQADRGENPVKIKEVIPHYHCCELDIEAPEGVFYRLSGMPKSMLLQAGIDRSAWAECLVTDDIYFIYSVAEQGGIPLSQKKEKDVFEYDSQMRPWFPQEVPSEPTDYVIACYTAKIEGGKVVVTSEPSMVEFTTKKIEDVGVRYNMSVEFNSLAMTVKAEAIETEGIDTNIPFAIDVYTADQIANANYSLPQLISQSVHNYENQVYKYGMSWDDVTFRTSGSKTYQNIKPGDIFLAVAYGLEWGVVNTDATQFVIEAPEPEITDDCTFNLSFTQSTTTSVSIDVEPSNETTQYVAFLVNSDRLNSDIAKLEAAAAENETEEDGESISALTRVARSYVDSRIHFLNQSKPKEWYDKSIAHTGKATLDSYSDLIDGMYMVIGEKYTVITCGIAADGGRCTEVSTIEVSTEAEPEVKELGFEVEFFDFKPSQYYPSVGYKVTPTDPEATYVVEFIATNNSNANLDKTDEEFIRDYVALQGQYLRLRQGTLDTRHVIATDYNSETGEFQGRDYYMVIFGYNGAPTTPLYVIKLTGENGDVEQIRGEQTILKQEVIVPDEPLTLDMQFSNWSAADASFHFITCDVTPSDNVNKYIFKVLSENAINPEGKDAETFIADYIANTPNLVGSPGAKKERVQFEKTAAASNAPFVNKYFLAFGFDGTKATTAPILYYVNGTTGKVTAIYQ